MKKYLIAVLAVMFVCGMPLSAQAMFTENFDGATIGTLPSGWVPDANATAAGNGVIADPFPSYTGDQALHLLSARMWAALLHHAASLEQEFEVSVSMMIQDFSYGTGTVDLFSAASHSSQMVRLFEFRQGALFGMNGYRDRYTVPLVTGLDINTWYDITVQYTRVDSASTGTVSYYLDGDYLGTWNTTSDWDNRFHYLTLVSHNYATGVYMNFDDVAVQALTDFSGGDGGDGGQQIPEPATMVLLAGGIAGLVIKRKK